MQTDRSRLNVVAAGIPIFEPCARPPPSRRSSNNAAADSSSVVGCGGREEDKGHCGYVLSQRGLGLMVVRGWLPHMKLRRHPGRSQGRVVHLLPTDMLTLLDARSSGQYGGRVDCRGVEVTEVAKAEHDPDNNLSAEEYTVAANSAAAAAAGAAGTSRGAEPRRLVTPGAAAAISRWEDGGCVALCGGDNTAALGPPVVALSCFKCEEHWIQVRARQSQNL